MKTNKIWNKNMKDKKIHKHHIRRLPVFFGKGTYIQVIFKAKLWQILGCNPLIAVIVNILSKTEAYIHVNDAPPNMFLLKQKQFMTSVLKHIFLCFNGNKTTGLTENWKILLM